MDQNSNTLRSIWISAKEFAFTLGKAWWYVFMGVAMAVAGAILDITETANVPQWVWAGIFIATAFIAAFLAFHRIRVSRDELQKTIELEGIPGTTTIEEQRRLFHRIIQSAPESGKKSEENSWIVSARIAVKSVFGDHHESKLLEAIELGKDVKSRIPAAVTYLESLCATLQRESGVPPEIAYAIDQQQQIQQQNQHLAQAWINEIQYYLSEVDVLLQELEKGMSQDLIDRCSQWYYRINGQLQNYLGERYVFGFNSDAGISPMISMIENEEQHTMWQWLQYRKVRLKQLIEHFQQAF